MDSAVDKGKSPDQKNGDGGDPIVKQSVDFVLAEYTTLRTEILQRVATRYQIMTLAFSAFSAVLAVQAFGAGNSAGIYLVLLYPDLAFFLCNMYISNSHRVHIIEQYIKINIEAKVIDAMQPPFNEIFGWHIHYANRYGGVKGLRLPSIGGRFIFPVTAAIALATAMLVINSDTSAGKLSFITPLKWIAIVSLALSLGQAIWDLIDDSMKNRDGQGSNNKTQVNGKQS